MEGAGFVGAGAGLPASADDSSSFASFAGAAELTGECAAGAGGVDAGAAAVLTAGAGAAGAEEGADAGALEAGAFAAGGFAGDGFTTGGFAAGGLPVGGFAAAGFAAVVGAAPFAAALEEGAAAGVDAELAGAPAAGPGEAVDADDDDDGAVDPAAEGVEVSPSFAAVMAGFFVPAVSQLKP